MVNTRMENRIENVEKDVKLLHEFLQKEQMERNNQFRVLEGKLSEISSIHQMLASLKEKLIESAGPSGAVTSQEKGHNKEEGMSSIGV